MYQQSKNGNNFYKLLEIIGSEQNICLAYRNLKTNSGSKTAGTDGKTIEDIKGLSDREVIETVRKQLADYHPQSVRRVFIPKPGSDKKRPLGIPCIWDRLIQQCILQVLEPICEPKFHNHSYGFRQNRDAHHAVSRVVSMVNMYKHYYCVDVDIKGFFDNVNHGKLLKQIWTLGIRDKRLALTGFYNYHGLTFWQFAGKMIYFSFFNRPLVYGSTESVQELKQIYMETRQEEEREVQQRKKEQKKEKKGGDVNVVKKKAIRMGIVTVVMIVLGTAAAVWYKMYR